MTIQRLSTTLALPGWLTPAVWPFQIRQISVDGSSIGLSEAGAGPTLLFYTGIGSFIWRDVMLRLSGGFRCVTLDPPGIGLSAAVPRSSATLERSSRAVAAVIEALDLQEFTLVVHDTGGPSAIAAAARTPTRVQGLVGVNTFGWRPSGPAFRGMLALMGSGAVRRFDLATNVLARVTATPFGVGRHLDDATRRVYRAGLSRGMGAFHDYLRDARNADDLYDDVALALRGPLARVPLLTIFGERNDPLGFQPQWKALFPAARQIVVKKGNHFPMCDAPDFVADAIGEWHGTAIGRPRPIAAGARA